jgi:RNA polymerase sigma factor (sigma-70 family)
MRTTTAQVSTAATGYRLRGTSPAVGRWSVPVVAEADFTGVRHGGMAGGCDALLDDAALIDRVQKGSAEAAVELADRLRPTILKCIRRRLPRWASEEDLMQSVLAKVFSHLHQFSGSVPLEHWVSRIAVNTSLSQISYENSRPELRMGDLTEEQEASVTNQAQCAAGTDDDGYAREAVEILLGQLTPDERQLITLLHLEQRSTREISELTGLSVSLVKVKAFRTRHKMQRIGRRLLKESGFGLLMAA